MSEVLSSLESATNVLLLEPSIGEGRETCTSLLTEHVADPNVLFVTFTRQAAECVRQLDGIDGIGQQAVISVGDGSSAVDREDVLTDSVAQPSDLTGLGITIGKFLSDLPAPVLICFDSLTTMLQYVGFDTAYEFLHAVTGQIYAAGARSHFHIDPAAHDDSDVAAITSLFDARVSLDGEPSVRTRDILQ